MNILFQMVHPAKYHFHKIAINKLIENGHNVEVLIQTKDMLEFLVKKENWKYKNLFPSGRKISFLPKILSNIVILIITIFRQLKYVHGKSFDLFVANKNGETALHLAAFKGHIDVVTALLRNGANPNVFNKLGITPLFMATQRGHTKVVEALLKNRADPNIARHSDSVTPLFIATQKGYLRVVKELLKKGADTYQASNDGTTPLQYAEMYGLDEIAAVLREVPNNNNIYSGSNDSNNEELFNKTFICIKIIDK